MPPNVSASVDMTDAAATAVATPVLETIEVDYQQRFASVFKQVSDAEDKHAVAATVVDHVDVGEHLDYWPHIAAFLADSLKPRTSSNTVNPTEVRLTACIVIRTLAAEHKPSFEPFLAPLLPALIELFADKQMAVRAPAVDAARTLVQALNANYIKCVLSMLFAGIDYKQKWQTKHACLDLIAEVATLSPYQASRCLPELIPAITECVWDTRREVQTASRTALRQVCEVVDNADIKPFIPALVSCMANPTEISECTHKLASTTFVKTVEAPALALMEPLLLRALHEGKTAVKRQAAVIIDNMCKLMDDPAEAQLFVPKLLPALQKLIDTVADPECRDVATRAYNTLFVAAGSVELSDEDMSVAYDDVLKVVQHCLQQFPTVVIPEAIVHFVAGVVLLLVSTHNFAVSAFEKQLMPYLELCMARNEVTAVAKAIRDQCFRDSKHVFIEDVDCDAGEPDLCNCEFSLAYGGMILLNNARLRLKRGHRYGLCGPNGCGKSTLLRAIANGQLDGFPSSDELKTVFVEHNLQASEAELPVLSFISNDAALEDLEVEEIQAMLSSVGFTDDMQKMPVGALSGGWKMKLELARAMLMKADILLLDEPTNHLDVANVAWLEAYLNSLTTVTSIMVSHDSGFLDSVCTNIIDYANRKLTIYRGNLSAFVEAKPEAQSYYDLGATAVKFTFPEPGFLADIKTKGKPILRLTNCSYQYPGAPKPSIQNISVTCSLASRIAVIGPNGAGKSTMIKMLTGEVEPKTGALWKHPSLRFAYVAQHAFHHIEQHLDTSANQYIQWRFQSGEDKELLAKATRKLSPEEQRHNKLPVQWDGEKRVLEEIVSRRKLKKTFEYEIKWEKLGSESNSWIARTQLERWGWDKLLQIADDREAARANLQARPVTAMAVQKHLDAFGLNAEFGTHSRMRGLSGGQKVKVVLAAAMWLNPHILVMDEPTNFLDRDSLGALAAAVNEFNGGVVMISHNREFTSALCKETWLVDNGTLSVDGEMPEDRTKMEDKRDEEVIDAFGNVSKQKLKRKLTRKERKAKEQARKEAEARGEYWSDSDDE